MDVCIVCAKSFCCSFIWRMADGMLLKKIYSMNSSFFTQTEGNKKQLVTVQDCTGKYQRDSKFQSLFQNFRLLFRLPMHNNLFRKQLNLWTSTCSFSSFLTHKLMVAIQAWNELLSCSQKDFQIKKKTTLDEKVFEEAYFLQHYFWKNIHVKIFGKLTWLKRNLEIRYRRE